MRKNEMNTIVKSLILVAISSSANADIVKYGDTLYIVNPTNGHASPIEPAMQGASMTAVSSNIVQISSGHYSYLYSVNPETGARIRIDLDRKAPEAGMVTVIK